MAAAAATTDIEAERYKKRWLGLAVIALAQLMVVLDATIVNIALPTAQAQLGITDANRQWIVTAYTLTFGGLLLLGGRIADYAGRKRVFLIGLVGFAAASALGGLAQNEAMLFTSRAIQGAFAALLAPAALSLITVTFVETHERAKAFGVYGAIAGGGAAIGLVLGGILTEFANWPGPHDGWRWCLLVNIFFAAIAFILAVPLLSESRAEGDRKYDIPGAVVVTTGLVLIVYGCTQAANPFQGWLYGWAIGPIVVGLLLVVLFVVIEARTKSPLLPLRVVLDRNRGGSFLTSLLVGVALFGMFLFLTLYLQEILHYSPLKSGVAFLPFSAGVIFSAGLASKLLPKFGPRPIMTTGLLLSTAGMLWLTQIGVDTSFTTHVLPSELLMSIGLGLTFVPLSSTALTGVLGHDAGVASAMVNTTQQIGGSLGIALLNTIAFSVTTAFVAANGVQHLAQAQVEGYATAFRWSAVLMFVAAIVAFTMITTQRGAIPQPEDALAVG